MKLSVVIPVYNVERYLRQCLDSVVNQTYKDLEIILVDDGSTDGCPQICDEYANAYDCVKVFHKENGGLVSAYIFGAQKSTGEYLTFVDSDDWLELDMYEKLLPHFTDNVNMVFCRYDRVYEDKSVPVEFGIEQGYYDRESVDKFFIKINRHYPSVVRWNKIYFTKDVKELLPMLDLSASFSEDALFNQLFAMKFLKGAYYLDTILYHYRFSENSMSSKFDEKKLRGLNKIYDLLKKYDDSGEYGNLIDGFYLEHLRKGIDAIFQSDYSDKEKTKFLKIVLNQSDLKCAIANGDWPCYNTKQRIKKFLIKHKMARLYFWLTKIRRG